MSYAQKQYQSVWLAVPPNAASDAIKKRPPPKSRRRLSTADANGSDAESLSESSASLPERGVPQRAEAGTLTEGSRRDPSPPTRTLPKRAAHAASASPATTPKPGPKASKKQTVVKAKPSSRKAKKKVSTKPEDRLFYSVRGADGRFVRVPIGSTVTYTKNHSSSSSSARDSSPRSNASKVTVTSVKNKSSSKRSKSEARPSPVQVKRPVGRPRKHPINPSNKPKKPKRIDRYTLRKQRVQSYPRDREHFYNKVVKPKRGGKKYYFVLNYNEDHDLLRLVPIVAGKNKLTGQREGRPRYQCVVGDTDENFLTVNSSDYRIVPSTMVMKTPFIVQEAWDVED